jgi:uridine kinase
MSQDWTPLVIGIAGGTGSGKTTVALEIIRAVGDHKVSFIQHDAYYKDLSDLPPTQRAQINFDHPNSLDTELMTRHIRSLVQGEDVDIPVYDFSTDTRTDKTIPVKANPVVIVEGILIFTEQQVRDLCDIKIFVDTDADIRLIRRIQRDVSERGRTVESVINQYKNTVRPMHLEFVEPSKRYADLIIPEGGYNKVALEMVIARVQLLLRGIKKAKKKQKKAKTNPS